MADVPPNRDELISQFVALAGVSPQVVSFAIHYVELFNIEPDTGDFRPRNILPIAAGISRPQSLNTITHPKNKRNSKLP